MQCVVVDIYMGYAYACLVRVCVCAYENCLEGYVVSIIVFLL